MSRPTLPARPDCWEKNSSREIQSELSQLSPGESFVFRCVIGTPNEDADQQPTQSSPSVFVLLV